MKDVFIGQYRMLGYAIQESLQHTLPAGNHCRILLRLSLLDSIVTNALLGGNGRND